MAFMLVDKGYYDYDYSEPKEKHKRKQPLKRRTREQVSSTLARFGFCTALDGGQCKAPSLEELQAEVIREEELKQIKNKTT